MVMKRFSKFFLTWPEIFQIHIFQTKENCLQNREFVCGWTSPRVKVTFWQGIRHAERKISSWLKGKKKFFKK